MRIGVYVDGYNLYYGMRGLCGRGTAGWRWLDLRALAGALVTHDAWRAGRIERVVYCTARIAQHENPDGYIDQDSYLSALTASGSVDLIEYGYYVSRVKSAPLAVEGRKGRPELVFPQWPVMVHSDQHGVVRDAKFMVSHARREEKGSDVSVASHLLQDTLRGDVDAAIVISNDSDLRFPVRETRKLVPVGMVNPSRNPLAGDLRGHPDEGVGRHWWRQLDGDLVRACQLPDPVGGYAKPADW